MIEQTQTITVSITEYIAALRDIAFVSGLFILGWKGRAWIQPAFEFFERANKHMDLVEENIISMNKGMNLLLDNHLAHMQKSLDQLVREKVNDEIT